jgi:hypothetical protein
MLGKVTPAVNAVVLVLALVAAYTNLGRDLSGLKRKLE